MHTLKVRSINCQFLSAFFSPQFQYKRDCGATITPTHKRDNTSGNCDCAAVTPQVKYLRIALLNVIDKLSASAYLGLYFKFLRVIVSLVAYVVN